MKKTFKLASKSILLCCFFIVISTISYSQSTKVVLDNYFKAIGGKEKASQVTTFASTSKGLYNSQEIIFKTKSKLPNKLHNTMIFASKVVSEKIFDGKSGRKVKNSVKSSFSKDEIKDYKNKRSIFPEFNYYSKAKYLGVKTIEGKKTHVLSIDNYEIYYDAKTGLKTKGIIKNKENKELLYSKYIPIEGLLFPSNLIIKVADKKIELQTVTISLNRDVNNQDFLH